MKTVLEVYEAREPEKRRFFLTRAAAETFKSELLKRLGPGQWELVTTEHEAEG